MPIGQRLIVTTCRYCGITSRLLRLAVAVALLDIAPVLQRIPKPEKGA